MSTDSRVDQQALHRVITAQSGEFQRSTAIAVGELGVRPGAVQGAQGALMPRAAITEHDGFDQSRPVQVVDMVDLRTGCEQLAHPAIVAQVGCGDECGAVVTACDQLGARPALYPQMLSERCSLLAIQ